MRKHNQHFKIPIRESKKNSIFLLIGVLGLLGVLVADLFFSNGRLFYKEVPLLNQANVIRSTVILSSVLFVILSLLQIKKEALNSLEILATPYQRRSLGISLFLALVFLALFYFSPGAFSYLSMEDNFTESTSVVLLFCNVVLILSALLRIAKQPNNFKLLKGILILMLIGFFVIAMEEISWFQRVLSLETPEAFKGNWQNEMNLHNFSTFWSENLYYFGAFLFLVLVPFAALFAQKFINRSNISILVPGVFVSIIASIAFAFNYTMWNSILVQISFFGSLILLLVLIFLCKDIWKRNVIILIGLLMLGIQITFLLKGEFLLRSWELTEYKEFFIPLAFFFYCGDVFFKTRKLSVSKE